MTVYRLENPKHNIGVYYNHDATPSNVCYQWKDGNLATIPMPLNLKIYHKDNKIYNSACDDLRILKHWFNKTDLDNLKRLGYKLYRFDNVTDYQRPNEFEVCFVKTPEVIKLELPISLIYEQSITYNRSSE